MLISNQSANVLVTGAAGFIGYHLTKKLCSMGYSVVGVDNLNDYYDINLKKSRLNLLKDLTNFHFAHHGVALQVGVRIFERITNPRLSGKVKNTRKLVSAE